MRLKIFQLSKNDTCADSIKIQACLSKLLIVPEDYCVAIHLRKALSRQREESFRIGLRLAVNKIFLSCGGAESVRQQSACSFTATLTSFFKNFNPSAVVDVENNEFEKLILKLDIYS